MKKMAKRFTDTELWDKQWFMELTPKLKCLVYLVRDKCDLAGIWHPNWIITCAYIGENVSEDELLGIDNGNQFVKLDNGKIYCNGFTTFQYGELKNSPVHKRVISILETNNALHLVKIKEVDNQESLTGRFGKFEHCVFSTILAESEDDRQDMADFISYWTECNGKKMRFEMEKVFDIKKRFATWQRNSIKFNKKPNNNDSKISGGELFKEVMRHATDNTGNS